MPFGLGFFATAGSGGAAGGAAYELISSTILTGSQSSVTFSNLGDYSSTYKHLQIRLVARTSTSAGGSGAYLKMQFNGDSSSSYRSHQLYGDGSSVTSNESGSATQINLQRIGDAGAAANNFGAIVVDILDAYSTKNKTIRQLGGLSSNFIFFNSGAWFNTSSLTSIVFTSGNSDNFVSGSRFSLYGIKG